MDSESRQLTKEYHAIEQALEKAALADDDADGKVLAVIIRRARLPFLIAQAKREENLAARKLRHP